MNEIFCPYCKKWCKYKSFSRHAPIDYEICYSCNRIMPDDTPWRKKNPEDLEAGGVFFAEPEWK